MDLGQKDIADLLNVGQKTYSDYELGKTGIPVDSVIMLVNFYSMDYICGVSDIVNKFPSK